MPDHIAIDPSREMDFQWLPTGGEALAEMLAAIAAAQRSVRLEMYIFDPSPVADHFRDALADACRRGATVQVLVDAFGSMSLPDGYWETLRAAGGQVRRFNPNGLKRFGIRDHRKILVCDDDLAIIGGANIAAEYHGDGVASGWRDLGLKIRGPLAAELAAASDEMFARADVRHKPFSRLRKSARQKTRSICRRQDSPHRPGAEQPDQTGVEPRPQTRGAGRHYLRLLFAAQPHSAPNGAPGPARNQSPIDPAGQVRRVSSRVWPRKVFIAASCGPGWRFTNTSRRFSMPKCFLLTILFTWDRPTSIPAASTSTTN